MCVRTTDTTTLNPYLRVEWVDLEVHGAVQRVCGPYVQSNVARTAGDPHRRPAARHVVCLLGARHVQQGEGGKPYLRRQLKRTRKPYLY